MFKATTMVNQQSNQIQFRGSHVIRYKGSYTTCRLFEVVKKPSYEVVYQIEYLHGLWILKNPSHEIVMQDFVLTIILSFVYKKLK